MISKVINLKHTLLDALITKILKEIVIYTELCYKKYN